LGQHKKALEHHQQALEIARKLGREANVASYLNNIGVTYASLRQYKEALEHFQRALGMSRKSGQEAEVALALNNIGMLYRDWGHYDKALTHFQQAQIISKALEHLQQALAINRKLGREADVARHLNNIGTAHYTLRRYDEAAADFRRSIDIIEKLRLTASGSLRMDYLASQIFTYRWRILSCLRDNDPMSAFAASETASAKYLIERLGRGDSGSRAEFMTTRACQSRLSRKTAIVRFSNVDWRETVRLVVTGTKADGAVVETSDFTSRINVAHGNAVNGTFSRLRGMRVREKPPDDAMTNREAPPEFDKIINYYRYLLASDDQANLRRRGIRVAKRGGEKDATETLDDISRRLYTFLFGDIEEHLKDKTELIVLPDGILAFLPFETLVMPDGRCMGEKYSIRYGQSMTVQNMIGKRKHPRDRKPILVMGGAVYEADTHAQDMIANEGQLVALSKQARLDLTRSASMRGYYGKLGYAAWENLPGTLTEANEISELMPGARALMGKHLTERNIKNLSASGRLAKYKVLHIATHGLVVPEIPDLSAVVLSQGVESEEDGYLRASEIAKLHLEADFVCLSACDTGLGKIYGGEGVVGLTQSFLVAGANGLCVSLWQVADESTRRFMVEMYRMVAKEEKSYAQSIAETKRKFIRGDFGDEYRDPYHWAPFVYYGRP